MKELQNEIKDLRTRLQKANDRANQAEMKRDEYHAFLRAKFNYFADLSATNSYQTLPSLLKEFARVLGAKI